MNTITISGFKAYDLRGRKFAVVMAGNPYTESGDVFKIPDMLANRADIYNLGDVLSGREAESAEVGAEPERPLAQLPGVIIDAQLRPERRDHLAGSGGERRRDGELVAYGGKALGPIVCHGLSPGERFTKRCEVPSG